MPSTYIVLKETVEIQVKSIRDNFSAFGDKVHQDSSGGSHRRSSNEREFVRFCLSFNLHGVRHYNVSSSND